MKIVIAVASGLALIAGLCLLVASSGGASCPKGQQFGIIMWYPQTIGSITTMQPMYGCVEG